MPRKKATIHNGGGLIPKALKSKAKAAKVLFQKMFKRAIPVHPDIQPHQTNIQNSSPSVVQEIPPLSIIEIANKWMEDPKKDPYTNKDIVLSIHPNSKYVKLYKKIIDKLIKYLLDFFPEKMELTIEDCKYIKNNLPIIHSIISIDHKRYIKYDHLFIIYFVNRTRKYKYDRSYLEDSEIKLYLNIYNSIITKDPLKNTSSDSQTSNSRSSSIDIHTSIEFLLRDNMDLNKTDICIGKLVVNLCSDILKILYMHKSKITEDNYNIALNNKKILAYVASLYKLNLVKHLIYDDINIYLETLRKDKKIEVIFETYNTLLYIYTYINTDDDKYKTNSNETIFNKFLGIYDTILSLYSNYFNKVNPSELITKNPEGRESSSSRSSRSSKKGALKLNPYCPKDAEDPVSLRTIRNFDDNKRKYVSNISLVLEDNNKILYHCFDTIRIYNYILGCVVEGKHPKNLYTATLFTDDDLDEICNKIKHFTDKSTYNSHVDIKEAIKKKQSNYNNYLLLSEEYIFYDNTINFDTTIKGECKLYLNIELGGVLFPIINSIPENEINKDFHNPTHKEKSFVLRLPIFTNIGNLKFVRTKMSQIQRLLMQGEYLNVKTFPYRKDNIEGESWGKIVKLPLFDYYINTPYIFLQFQSYIKYIKL